MISTGLHIDWALIISGCILGVVSFMATQLWSFRSFVSESTMWMKAHEKQDDERHKIELVDRKDLWSAVNEMRKTMKRRSEPRA